MNEQEKNMLRTARKLREVVAADFMMKTANPAIAAVLRALGPALRSLGPKVLQMLKKIPPEVWAQVIPGLVNKMAPKNAPAGAAGANRRAAAEDKKPWEKDDDEDDDKEEDDDKDDLACMLKEGGVANSDIVARALILASIEAGNNHRRKANRDVEEAIRLVHQMRTELKTIKEYL